MNSRQKSGQCLSDFPLWYWEGPDGWHGLQPGEQSGVGNGNRTRNRRSHSPVLCQLSYSHRHVDYTTAVR